MCTMNELWMISQRSVPLSFSNFCKKLFVKILVFLLVFMFNLDIFITRNYFGKL